MPALLQTPSSVNMTVKLDGGDRQRLQVLAATKKRTPHYLMREAIQAYIEKEEAEQNFIAAAEGAWADYEKTGLHITLDEAKTWAKQLDKNPRKKLPACHT
jgi:predicted transcriptional regulator